MAGLAGVGGATRIVVSDGRDYDVQIARLRRQVTALTKQLRDVASSDDDATSKASQQALINAKIQLAQAEIARLQSQQRSERTSDRDPGPVVALSVEQTNRNVIEEYAEASAFDVVI